MANSLSLGHDSPAHRFYASLRGEARASVDAALEYIRDLPFENGDIIAKRLLPPVVVYEYTDGEWRISYSLSFRPAEVGFHISWAIAHA